MKEFDVQMMLYRKYFNSVKIMIPNYTPFKWFECDMFALTKSGYMREWEIKLTKADFKADKKKQRKTWNWGKCEYDVTEKHSLMEKGSEKAPKNFWYVVPEEMITVDEVPEFSGLIYICGNYLRKVKPAPVIHRNKPDRKIEPHAYSVLYHRYWNEKVKIERLQKDISFMELSNG